MEVMPEIRNDLRTVCRCEPLRLTLDLRRRNCAIERTEQLQSRCANEANGLTGTGRMRFRVRNLPTRPEHPREECQSPVTRTLPPDTPFARVAGRESHGPHKPIRGLTHGPISHKSTRTMTDNPDWLGRRNRVDDRQHIPSGTGNGIVFVRKGGQRRANGAASHGCNCAEAVTRKPVEQLVESARIVVITVQAQCHRLSRITSRSRCEAIACCFDRQVIRLHGVSIKCQVCVGSRTETGGNYRQPGSPDWSERAAHDPGTAPP